MCLSMVCPTLQTDVGERRGTCHQNLPRGVDIWLGLSQSTQNHIYILLGVKCFLKILCEFHKYPYLPVTHCARHGDRGICVRVWYAGLCLRNGGMLH